MRCGHLVARLIVAIGLLTACNSDEAVQVDVTVTDLTSSNSDVAEQDVGTDT